MSRTCLACKHCYVPDEMIACEMGVWKNYALELAHREDEGKDSDWTPSVFLSLAAGCIHFEPIPYTRKLESIPIEVPSSGTKGVEVALPVKFDRGCMADNYHELDVLEVRWKNIDGTALLIYSLLDLPLAHEAFVVPLPPDAILRDVVAVQIYGKRGGKSWTLAHFATDWCHMPEFGNPPDDQEIAF